MRVNIQDYCRHQALEDGSWKDCVDGVLSWFIHQWGPDDATIYGCCSRHRNYRIHSLDPKVTSEEVEVYRVMAT
jgi:hypothetical protein